MSFIPRGSLVLNNFGNGQAKFLDSSGTDLGIPASLPDLLDWDLAYLEGQSIYVANVNSGNGGKFVDDQFVTLGYNFSIAATSSNSFATDAAGNVYIITGNSPNRMIRKFDSLGVLQASYGPLGTGTWSQLAVNAAGTIAYYAIRSAAGSVRSWNLTGNVGLGIFASEVGTTNPNRPGSLRTLPDDSVLIGWHIAGGTDYIKRYNTAGALQNTYTLPALASMINIALDCDTSVSPSPSISTQFWANYYRQPATDDATSFIRFRVSDGATLDQFDKPAFTPGNAYDGAFGVVRVDVGSVPVPVITCPLNQSVTTPDSNTSQVVTFPDPTATGGTPPYTFTVNPPSGSTFQPGVTVVTAGVEDSLGVEGDTCQFTVTVTPQKLLKYGGAIGFTTDVSSLPSNAELFPAPLIGVGNGSIGSNQFLIWPASFDATESGRQSLVVKHYEDNTGTVIILPNVVKAAVLDAVPFQPTGTLTVPSQQVFEVVFELSTYDPVTETCAADGYLAVYIDNTLVLELTGILLGRPTNLGKWDNLIFSPDGWASSYYISDRSVRYPGYGTQSFASPAPSVFEVTGFTMLSPFTYPIPTDFQFVPGTPDIIDARNFSDQTAASLFTPTGPWEKVISGVGNLPSLETVGYNLLLISGQNWPIAAQMLMGLQSGGIQRILAPTPITPPTPPPTSLSGCVIPGIAVAGSSSGCIIPETSAAEF